jgi:histidyl-tRNA synthetase
VALVGDAELAAGEVTVRDLARGQQERWPRGDVAARLAALGDDAAPAAEEGP